MELMVSAISKLQKKCSALPTELWGTSSLGAGRFVEFIFTFERNETMNEDGDATSACKLI